MPSRHPAISPARRVLAALSSVVAAAALTVGATPAPLGAQLWSRDCKPSTNGTQISIHDDDDGGTLKRRMLVVDGSHCLDVRSAGAVAFTDDESDVASLASGGYLHVFESRGGVTHRVEFDERGGRVTRRYWRDGDERSDADAGAWLRTMLPQVARESGIGAEARVARLLRQRGPAAVIDEIGVIRSESVKQIYVDALLRDQRVGIADTRALAQRLPRLFSSDSKRNALLRTLLDRADGDAATTEAVLEATRSMSSDRMRGEVLRTVAARNGLPTPLLLTALGSARRMSSDREKAAVLIALAGQRTTLADSAVRRAFLEVTRTISSSSEYRRVMESVVR